MSRAILLRHAALVAAVVLSLSVAAQQQPNRIHLFIANPSFTFSESAGSDFNAGFGLAYQRALSPRWGVELGITRERQYSHVFVDDVPGNTVTLQQTWYSTPVDLAALYHFNNGSSWRPYLGPAVRWTDSSNEPGDDARLLYGAEAGVVWQFHARAGLRFDAKFLAGDVPRWTDRVNGSVGLSWRF